MEEESNSYEASNSLQLRVVENGRQSTTQMLNVLELEIKENGVDECKNEDIELDSHSKLQFVKMFVTTKWKKVLEISLVSAIILLAWSLLTIPTILYALPPRIRTVCTTIYYDHSILICTIALLNFIDIYTLNNTAKYHYLFYNIILICTIALLYFIYTLSIIQPNITISGFTASGSLCDQSTAYEGQVCSSQLLRWQQCFSTVQSGNIQISSYVDQQIAEDTASMLIRGLPLLSPSPECEEAIKPFVCLYLFGSCDTDNQLHQATQADCLRLRDGVCAQEWALATNFLGEGTLPDCNSLLQQDDQC